MNIRNYYEVLGVARNASPAEIKAQYIALARQHHPDIGGSAKDFAPIGEAYEILSDPGKRAAYDSLVRPKLGLTEGADFGADIVEFLRTGVRR